MVRQQFAGERVCGDPGVHVGGVHLRALAWETSGDSNRRQPRVRGSESRSLFFLPFCSSRDEMVRGEED